MKITENLEITLTKEGSILVTFEDESYGVPYTDEGRYPAIKAIYNRFRATHPSLRGGLVEQIQNEGFDFATGTFTNPSASLVNTMEYDLKKGLGELIAFFKDFQFTPSFRMVNTFAHVLADKGMEGGKSYFLNYFKLMDNTYKLELEEKMKSPEFGHICAHLGVLRPASVVNKRLKVWYGPQGTGKTTQALAMTGSNCIGCNSSMLPSDLMEDFDFEDGKATFKKSLLRRCMEEGEALTFDEINLLPYETLRFLQTLTDNKESITYKGEVVHIKEGFTIIGTMNLVVNGCVFPLPEPLVDRCSEIKEVLLDPAMLLGAYR